MNDIVLYAFSGIQILWFKTKLHVIQLVFALRDLIIWHVLSVQEIRYGDGIFVLSKLQQKKYKPFDIIGIWRNQFAKIFNISDIYPSNDNKPRSRVFIKNLVIVPYFSKPLSQFPWDKEFDEESIKVHYSYAKGPDKEQNLLLFVISGYFSD